MKKLISGLTAIALFAATTIGLANAQTAGNLAKDFSYNNAYKTRPTTIGNASSLVKSSFQLKAEKNFSKSFKNALNAHWGITVEGTPTVSFQEGENVKVYVYYNEKGNEIFTLKKYDENKLDTDLRKQIKMTYFDYAINNVDEITTPANKLYLVSISNAKLIKKIIIENGEISEGETCTNAGIPHQ